MLIYNMNLNNNQKSIPRNVYQEGARCISGRGSILTHLYINYGEKFIMATTGELRAIIEELQLVDIGEA
ncbi:MAG TPA: hypothetical protein VEI53_04755, partial [Ktedonobacteraceae bacterium]|nr:hypothetical protein [Ktedonobacteraceae bacterium]